MISISIRRAVLLSAAVAPLVLSGCVIQPGPKSEGAPAQKSVLGEIGDVVGKIRLPTIRPKPAAAAPAPAEAPIQEVTVSASRQMIGRCGFVQYMDFASQELPMEWGLYIRKTKGATTLCVDDDRKGDKGGGCRCIVDSSGRFPSFESYVDYILREIDADEEEAATEMEAAPPAGGKTGSGK